MQKLKTLTDVIIYATESTLETIAILSMAGRTKIPEYKRQVEIAQNCVDFIKSKHLEVKQGRLKSVLVNNFSVEEWSGFFKK